MLLIRSLLFSLMMILYTVFFATLAILLTPLPFIIRSSVLRWYAWLNINTLRLLCGVRYRVEGRENIPDGPVVIFSKHQSTWETYALQTIFMPICYVFKHELVWVPFFGWALATMKPIAIKRGSGKRAVETMTRVGKQRLDEGISVVIFPEGTRTSPSGPGRYRIGGAVMAVESGYPVVPVAHNAGECWPRKGFIKRPGLITVRVGPPIETRGKAAEVLLEEIRQWIETQMVEISRPGYPAPGDAPLRQTPASPAPSGD
ncbi:MAG TPA: 1-acyl-sn-glycerol-3-phosphate acyltransferase [Gammaproteobacteria bacterium]|nr:1-acyl-sn-glycerol-3-phosphate acyltransferase [Gammaproteobacteria bacterium]